jgi:hypothetical protein
MRRNTPHGRCFSSRVADLQHVVDGGGGVFTPPPERARALHPDCTTTVVHRCPCGGFLMTRLRTHVDNRLEGRSISRGEEVRA